MMFVLVVFARSHWYVILCLVLWFWLVLAAAFHVSDLYIPSRSAAFAGAVVVALPLSLFFPLWTVSAFVLFFIELAVNRLRR